MIGASYIRTRISKSLLANASRAAARTPPTTRNLFTRAAPTPLARAKQFFYLVLALAGGTLTLTYYLDSRSGIHRWVIIPALKATTDPETAQKLAIKLLETGLAPKDLCTDDQIIRTELFGKSISNPIGLAAGFDKQAEAIDGLFDLGFGFIEVGSVTPEPQPGNPQPRYFRLTQDEASINRFGFNSEGHSIILSRLRDRVRRWLLHSSNVATLQDALVGSPEHATNQAEQVMSRHPKSNLAFVDAVATNRSLRQDKLLAVNLGKNKTSAEESVDDYVKGVERLGPYADLIVVNVSSPNTPGLRRLQRRGVLEDLLTKVVKARNEMVESHLVPAKEGKVKVPLLVKIAPDLSQEELNDVADAAVNSGIDGLVISNTTISRPANLRSSEHVRETGGLSGPPVKPLALKALQTVYCRLRGELPIIGCGGIATGQDALDFAKAGASAIELYTSFGYQGVGLPRQIKDELTELLKKEGKTWSQVIGADINLQDVQIKSSNDEVPMGLNPSRDEAFKKSPASVKLELEGIKNDFVLNSTSSFIPNKEGKTQGEKAAERADEMLKDPQGPSIKVKLEDKTKKVFGDNVKASVSEATDATKNRDYGKLDIRAS